MSTPADDARRGWQTALERETTTDRRCLRCGALTPGRLVVTTIWGEVCWGCGDVDSCVDAPAPPSAGRIGLRAIVDPYALLRRLATQQWQTGPASKVRIAMPFYAQFCALVARMPPADRDALVAAGSRVFFVRQATLRADVALAKAPAP
jgi:hypothetical protein